MTNIIGETPPLGGNEPSGGGILVGLVAVGLTAVLLGLGAIELMEYKMKKAKNDNNSKDEA